MSPHLVRDAALAFDGSEDDTAPAGEPEGAREPAKTGRKSRTHISLPNVPSTATVTGRKSMKREAVYWGVNARSPPTTLT